MTIPAAFPAWSVGLLGLFSVSQKLSLEKGQGTPCQRTWYSSADFQSVNTRSFACFDYHQKERETETVLLLHCFPTRIKSHETVCSHPYFEFLREF